jgi:LysM repeat protein
VDAASACAWHTVVPNDTLGNLGYWNGSSALAIARANHIRNPNRIYVGQRLCIPRETWAAAHRAPPVPQGQALAVPIVKAPAQQPSAPAAAPARQPAAPAPAAARQAPAPAPAAAPVAGILPGEPCAADRAIVWTVPVSRWAVPPGCFGGVYAPNPYAFQVNGHVIPGFGWCNWWPEALLRDPNAIFKPGHSTPRVGAAVYWAPQPGDRTGHYGFVESIGPNGWILISEMNMYWRGAGWAKVNYRYIRVDYPGASYRY